MATLLAWIIVFGVLVAVHELGHFSMAKALGMRVNEYALGFGPALWKRQQGETLYAVRLIPLGGYVRLAGMEGDQSEDRREFPNRPLWQRFIVILAGPFMNLLLAAVLYGITFGPVGMPSPTTIVARTMPQYPAYSAGIRPGDRIVAINHHPVGSWHQLVVDITKNGSHPLHVTVRAAVQPQVTRTFLIRPRYDPQQKGFIIGIQPQIVTVHRGLWSAIGEGVHHTIQLTGLWFQALARLISGRGRFDVAGPVGIAVLVGQAARAGLVQLLLLAAALSANLGLFNVLPIPVLDGSRLFLLGLEAVRRRALDPAYESMIFLVGMVVMLLFVLFVTVHDVGHLLHVPIRF